MLRFTLAAIKEGHSTISADLNPKDVGLEENTEFNKTIHLVHQITKVENEAFISTTVQTTLDLQCDVCLDSFQFDVKDKVDLILTADPDLADREDEDIYPVADSISQVDISESIRQFLLLAIPFKKICKPNCRGLCPTCGTNLNKGSCSCQRDDVDPRWEALKNIKFE